MVESINKRRFVLTIFLFFLSMNNVSAKGQILEREELSNPGFNFVDVYSINLFIDDGNSTFVLIGVQGENRYGNDFLYMNNKWEVIDEQGKVLSGFIKDGYFHLAFQKEEDVVIYNIQKDIKFVSRIKISSVPRSVGSYHHRVIPVSDQNSSYYFLSRRVELPAHPIEFLRTIMSGGHGIYYEKPVLAEIQDDEMSRYREIRYGGKIDETFIIKEVVKGKDSIHFLGFRGAEEPETSGSPAFAGSRPVILYYTNYDLKKKETTRKCSIYEDTPRYDKNKNADFYYGPLSMDNLDDNIFIIFSWVERRRNSNLKETKLDIYYNQSSNNNFGDIEKIGNGFSPLVRVDFLGNVHVVWIDSNGGLAHKVKKTGRWSDEKIILNNLDIYPNITRRYISAEFDKDNNLHVVYPSGGNLFHAKIKLDFMPDKQK